jgi:hypothetical protein
MKTPCAFPANGVNKVIIVVAIAAKPSKFFIINRQWKIVHKLDFFINATIAFITIPNLPNLAPKQAFDALDRSLPLRNKV